MEKAIQVVRCEIDAEQKILDIAVEGTLPYVVQSERFRMAAVFQASDRDRYFPVTAYRTACNEIGTRFRAAARIQLDAVFYEYHPAAPDDIILLRFTTCTPHKTWLDLETGIRLRAALFQTPCREMGWRGSLRRLCNILLYGVCTILLPVWLLSGYLASRGYGTLHPAAQGRQGKQAVLYHAHGLVHGWTGYGYSIREIKTQYVRKWYIRYCRRCPQTEGILFLSERRVETDGNLDLVRHALQEKMADEAGDVWPMQEFLIERTVDRLTWDELRRLARLTAGARVIILEDFYPQLHAISLRPDTRVLQLWHACGAFKLFGLSDMGVVSHLEQDTRNHRCYHAAIASSAGIVPFYAEAYGVSSDRIHPVGVPRTDCFFQPEHAAQVRERLCRDYPVLQGKKIVLFAPTFRGSGKKTAYYPADRFQIDRVMEGLPDDTVLVIKNHPFVRMCFPVGERYRERVLDLSEAESVNDLLFVTDILVTDYSSVIFEAVLLQIPMLFYVYDLQEYLSERDIYFDFASFIPGEMVTELPELAEGIRNGLADGTAHETDAVFREFFLGALDGHSTERVVQLVETLYRDAAGAQEWRIIMYEKWNKELDRLEQGKSRYVWDEIEELITDDFEEERLTVDEFDKLMERLMGISE